MDQSNIDCNGDNLTSENSWPPIGSDNLEPNNDPWTVTASTDATNIAASVSAQDENVDEIVTEDFSQYTPEQCLNLFIYNKKCVKEGSDPACIERDVHTTEHLQGQMSRAVDYDYLKKLERRLSKIKCAESKDQGKKMINQMIQYSEQFFTEGEPNQDETQYEPIPKNFIASKLFPHTQALTAEELIRLTDSDLLAEINREHTNDSSSADSKQPESPL